MQVNVLFVPCVLSVDLNIALCVGLCKCRQFSFDYNTSKTAHSSQRGLFCVAEMSSLQTCLLFTTGHRLRSSTVLFLFYTNVNHLTQRLSFLLCFLSNLCGSVGADTKLCLQEVLYIQGYVICSYYSRCTSKN